MRFKQKITLVFTGLTALIFLMIGFIMYFLTERLTRQEFFTRLKLRTEIAAKARLEINKSNGYIYDEIRKEQLITLPDEKEYFLELEADKKTIKNVPADLPEVLLSRILKNGYAEYTKYGVYSVGIIYPVQEKSYVVIISASDPVGKQDLQRLKGILLFSFLIMCLLSFIIGRWFSNQFIKPLAKMIVKVNNISAFNLDLRFDPAKKGKGELAELADTFNNMLDRLETAFQIQNNFVSNASHELRTPLTAILGAVELSLINPQVNNTKETLELVHKQASRLNEIINGLLKLAQSGYNSKKQLNEVIRLDELILSILDDISITNPDNQIQLDFSKLPESSNDLAVLGTEPLLRLAINNILQNACKYSDNKPVGVKLFISDNKICLKVSDNGIGIPKMDLEHIFELFFRASNHGNRMGFGLGLPLSYRILKVHHAVLDIQSVEGKGTDVAIYFNKLT